MTNDNNHSANYLVSRFLNSKRSLKNVYNLSHYEIVILRYICDCIDLNYQKRKSRSVLLYNSQIAKYSRCSLRKVIYSIKYLIKKRILIREKSIFSIGKVLTTYARCALRLDVCTPCTSVRSMHAVHPSNLSNLSNRDFSNPKKIAKYLNKQVNSPIRAEKPSPLLMEYMNGDDRKKDN